MLKIYTLSIRISVLLSLFIIILIKHIIIGITCPQVPITILYTLPKQLNKKEEIPSLEKKYLIFIAIPL